MSEGPGDRGAANGPPAATGSSAPPAADTQAQVFVRWSLVNLFLAVLAIGLTLWALLEEQGVRREIVRIGVERTKECARAAAVVKAPPKVEEVVVVAPPQDPPKSGYIGDAGAAILPALRLKLEALRAGHAPDAPLEWLRLGSPEVLPPGTIHVVNLWATWCSPCLAELPDFKALFARRADWGEQVRFVPIQVKDGVSPEMAYRDKAKIMPDAKVMLADRGLNDPLVAALTEDQQRALFEGKLPVTLILDCNRRVRWAQFEQLSAANFEELETFVDKFRAELNDTAVGAWCTQAWPGNGRCEGLEDTPAHHSLEDCGELKRRPGTPRGPGEPVEPGEPGEPGEPVAEVVPVDPVPVAEECPPNMIRTANGKCTRKLRGSPATPTKAAEKPSACGNGVCDLSETSSTCCQDCPCDAPLVCKRIQDGTSKCTVKGLKL